MTMYFNVFRSAKPSMFLLYFKSCLIIDCISSGEAGHVSIMFQQLSKD
jgi:hypothetical protein